MERKHPICIVLCSAKHSLSRLRDASSCVSIWLAQRHTRCFVVGQTATSHPQRRGPRLQAAKAKPAQTPRGSDPTRSWSGPTGRWRHNCPLRSGR
ncbi:hypothetical protein SETIT_9G353300v2 [Setaria italica]|nr:hypothetical protein SETIT_9G353300v2 [Setaria italica]